MFSYIKGKIGEKDFDRVVIEANGVGYELLCSESTLSKLTMDSGAMLFVHFNISQDAVALYGFIDKAERAMFRKLISVTRVGPKLALSVLSKLTVSDIAQAVLTDNAAAFDRIPGMGKKTAARVMLELKEKISSAQENFSGEAPLATGGIDMRSETVAALVSLGYDGVSAGRAVAAVQDCERIEDMLTAALKIMAKGK